MASSRVISKSCLEKFLLENSFRGKFYVEYDGFLSNHLAHAAIALFYLRAPATHLEGFAAAYVGKLESTSGTAATKQRQSEVGLLASTRFFIETISG